ncbi:unnamed protein product [Calypogeia fissa]
MDIDMDATGDSSVNSFKTVETGGHLSGLEMEIVDLDGPPDGFVFVLPFLDLQSRLTMERVSKSLREAVRNNPLVWQHLQVERPAVRKLTDDILLTLVGRAEGHLKSFSLTESLRTTDAALEEIFALNPEIEKLSVPGCTGISSEAIVKLVETLSLRARARGLPGIKQVEIRGLYNITKEHLDRLHSVLPPVGNQGNLPTQLLTPQYYGNGADTLRKNDVRPIDVSVCPLCANVRVVYDCTKHWIKYNKDDPCRACTFCIPRCEECGCCIREISHDESLCPDLVCEDCWPSLLKCSECNRAVYSRHAQSIQREDHNYTCELCLSAAYHPEFVFDGEI